MAEVPFRPARQLSEYKGKGASASRESARVFHSPPTPKILPPTQILIKNPVNISHIIVNY